MGERPAAAGEAAPGSSPHPPGACMTPWGQRGIHVSHVIVSFGYARFFAQFGRPGHGRLIAPVGMPTTGTTTGPTGHHDRCTAAPGPTLERSCTQIDPLWALQSMDAALAAAAPSGGYSRWLITVGR